MNTYLSTFISGFDSFISKELAQDVPDAERLQRTVPRGSRLQLHPPRLQFAPAQHLRAVAVGG